MRKTLAVIFCFAMVLSYKEFDEAADIHIG